jgi:hypothetical protein
MSIVTLGQLLPAVVERFNQATNRNAWQPATYYSIGLQRVANGQLWRCTTAGLSATSGTGPALVYMTDSHGHQVVDPTASANVVDGAAHWAWVSPAIGSSTTPITSIIGEQGEGQNDAPPRFVWVPTRDSFGPAMQVGPKPRGRSVRTRNAGVECHLWAQAATPNPGENLATASLSIAEQLLNDLVWSVHEELRAGLAPDGDTWWSWGCLYRLGAVEWQTKGTLMQNGCECVAELTFALPVIENAMAIVTPETFTLTNQISVNL